ncbi:class I adenylate-forming enzyme family protein [Peribacillus tepidiphilus]|uniref:class I adenylate-forming enzyme family protein n=1 Tax=Peribacillus tepidiphilus TaxID=2652445 RepID=UPI0035B52C30
MTNHLDLWGMFKRVLLENKNKDAVIFNNQTLSYGDLYYASNRFANALYNHDVKENTRVALVMSNCKEYVIAFLAIMQTGATLVPLNDRLGQKEINHIIESSGAELAIVDEGFIEIIEKTKRIAPSLKTIVAITEKNNDPQNFINWEAFQGNMPDTEIHRTPSVNEIGLILYTGGTTGLPKGVVHPRSNLISNYLSHIIELELEETDKILLTSPLPHSAGFILAAGLLKGATHYIEKKFDPQVVLERMDKDQITTTFMVPTMIYRVMDYFMDCKEAFNINSLRTIVYGAAPITEERLKTGLELFGPVFMQLYGQSEAPNFITKLKKSDHIFSGNHKENKRLRSCGQPVLMSEVKIVDDNGIEVPRGKPGEIIAKTPYNMTGYYQNPEQSNKTLKDGWLYTGDLAYMDENDYIYLLDRKKDIVITGGLNVYTTEVENAIQNHPGVSQVAVIGLPHSDWGEAITAFIVRKNESVSAESILEHCRNELSSYKRPKKIEFIDSIPLTPYGKIDKKALRKPYWELMGRNIN